MKTQTLSIDDKITTYKNNLALSLLVVPFTALALTCAGYGLNQKEYFDKVNAGVAAQDAKIYDKNNKDMAGMALASGALITLIAAGTYKSEKKTYKNKC